jgi:5-methylcytosine-specific restriction endonuclease McrA
MPRIPTSRNGRRRRNVVVMWYKHIGPHCAYCGVEMVDHLTAFEINYRNDRNARHLHSKDERRLLDNHPTVEHIVPKSKGGTYTYKNLVVACKKCNFTKDDETWPVRKGILIAWHKVIDRHLTQMGELNKPKPKD